MRSPVRRENRQAYAAVLNEQLEAQKQRFQGRDLFVSAAGGSRAARPAPPDETGEPGVLSRPDLLLKDLLVFGSVIVMAVAIFTLFT